MFFESKSLVGFSDILSANSLVTQPMYSVLKNHPLPLPRMRKIFLFAYFFEMYIKFGYKNPFILAPSNSVAVAT